MFVLAYSRQQDLTGFEEVVLADAVLMIYIGFGLSWGECWGLNSSAVCCTLRKTHTAADMCVCMRATLLACCPNNKKPDLPPLPPDCP